MTRRANVGLAQMRDKFAREELADAVAAGASMVLIRCLARIAEEARRAHALAAAEVVNSRTLDNLSRSGYSRAIG
jgi:hypothetical protein